VVFQIEEAEFAELPDGSPIAIRGLASQAPWTFAPLDKSGLR
jgi:hypothetical protein